MTFGELVVIIDFRVVDGSLFDEIIGDWTIEQIEGVIDLGNRLVRLTKDGHTFVVLLEPDYSGAINPGQVTDSEDFTYAYYTIPSSSDGEGSTSDEYEEELVIVMHSDVGDEENSENTED